jgi:hypothetical protein
MEYFGNDYWSPVPAEFSVSAIFAVAEAWRQFGKAKE